VKDWRENGGCLGAYWVCKRCLGLPDDVFWQLYGVAYHADASNFWEWLERTAQERGETVDEFLNAESVIDIFKEHISFAK